MSCNRLVFLFRKKVWNKSYSLFKKVVYRDHYYYFTLLFTDRTNAFEILTSFFILWTFIHWSLRDEDVRARIDARGKQKTSNTITRIQRLEVISSWIWAANVHTRKRRRIKIALYESAWKNGVDNDKLVEEKRRNQRSTSRPTVFSSRAKHRPQWNRLKIHGRFLKNYPLKNSWDWFIRPQHCFCISI